MCLTSLLAAIVVTSASPAIAHQRLVGRAAGAAAMLCAAAPPSAGGPIAALQHVLHSCGLLPSALGVGSLSGQSGRSGRGGRALTHAAMVIARGLAAMIPPVSTCLAVAHQGLVRWASRPATMLCATAPTSAEGPIRALQLIVYCCRFLPRAQIGWLLRWCQ